MQKKSTPQLRSPRLRSGQAILIVKITPPVLQKGLVWFLENKKRIEKEWRGQNALALSLGQIFPLSRLLRALDEAGYEKTIRVRLPGEFAQRGGVVDIFPINQPQALRIEYRGNVIESIDTLEETHNPDPQKPLKHWVRSQKSPGEQIESLAPGSYVVHQDHGIGIFRGCRKSDFLHVGSLTSYIRGRCRCRDPDGQHMTPAQVILFVLPGIFGSVPSVLAVFAGQGCEFLPEYLCFQ